LKAIVLDDACHATDTDRETSLTQLLGDDIDCGIGIEETVADDLAFELIGADIVSFGAALLSLEGGGSPIFE
jgi:hypothetical protein